MLESEMGKRGAIAAGHRVTAEAGLEVLKAGGNAYDAAIAAFFASCVAEPVLSSLGGGGFLLSQSASDDAKLFDFFVQTPRQKAPVDEVDFKPIWADFGTTRQEFHIGQGAVATPGVIKGMFKVHEQLASMPMTELVQPAILAARRGVRLNELQAYIFSIVEPILTASQEAAEIFTNESGKLIGQGDLFCLPELADTLDCLSLEGEKLFYEGALAQQIVSDSRAFRGHLHAEDLSAYAVIERKPLMVNYRNRQVITNSPPSSGGILIAFALQLWQQLADGAMGFGSFDHLQLLAQVMERTNEARVAAHLDDNCAHPSITTLLDDSLLQRYREKVLGRRRAYRGTTHISVIDRWHNRVSLTVSNGEGCGRMLAGTGIMLNNMLGEEDLNPRGFHLWQTNQRMTSMMAPTIINNKAGDTVVLGSGGSNRIRTAILQALINLVDFGHSLEEAVCQPRLHVEKGLLNVEKGFDREVLKALLTDYPNHKCWNALNLFFGGVHSVQVEGGNFSGIGDPRRGGVCLTL